MLEPGVQELPGVVVAEGEAVRFLKKFKKVKLCEGGKLKYKKRSEVEVVPACNGGFLVSLSFFQESVI